MVARLVYLTAFKHHLMTALHLSTDGRAILTESRAVKQQQDVAAAGIGEKIFQKFSRFLPIWPAETVRVPILMYHYVSDNPNPGDKIRKILTVTPEAFTVQMAYLAQNDYTAITLDTLYSIFYGQITPPAKPIVLTFDDGYADFYLNAYPILQKYNFCAVSFIIMGAVGKGYYLSWDQIRALQSSDLIHFEAHTVTHPNLTKLNPKSLLSELQESKHILQEEIGQAVQFISYPYGRTNTAVINAARAAGFVGGVAIWYGKASYPCMNMPRMQIDGQWTLSTFASRI